MISPDNKFLDMMNGIRLKIKDKTELEIWMNSNSTKESQREELVKYLKPNLHVSEEKAFTFWKF